MAEINYENGILNMGDTSRIRRAMAKAMNGEKITVGFLGGSITQGCLSSVPEKCYAYLVYEWWKKTFPKAEVSYVNAGIGGTPSDFGVARVDDDMLKFKPDFSIVEFSVNDVSNDYYKETYEGLIRHILKDKSGTGLMLVHNVRYDNMDSAEDKHLLIGKYYDLPCVSMKHSIYPEVANGNIPNRDITQDDLHPNDYGHKLVADVIIYALEKILSKVLEKEGIDDNSKEASLDVSGVQGTGTQCTGTQGTGTQGFGVNGTGMQGFGVIGLEMVGSEEKDIVLKKPLTKNTYENSLRLQNRNYKALMQGFIEDHTPQEHITEMFRYGYTGWKEGDYISFDAECTSISVQYRKSVNKPTPIAVAVVDGDEENKVILDGNFEEDWGDCLYTQPVLVHGNTGKHNVKITIIKDHSNEDKKDVVPFYLVSVIAAK